MAVKVKVTQDIGNRKVFAQIKAADRNAKQAIRRAFYFIGKDLTKTARRSIIEGPKTGRVYRRKVNGRLRRHRASAPGEPPANFRGALQRSIDFEVKGSDEMVFGAGGSTHKGIFVDYAGFLELGTPKMKARTYLIRAIDKRRKQTRNYFERELEKRLKK